jgi:hypothetical protein
VLLAVLILVEVHLVGGQAHGEHGEAIGGGAQLGLGAEVSK